MKQNISEAELEVMKVLWQMKNATSAEIIEVLKDKSGWKPKTIQTLITRLVSKEVVQVIKAIKNHISTAQQLVKVSTKMRQVSHF